MSSSSPSPVKSTLHSSLAGRMVRKKYSKRASVSSAKRKAEPSSDDEGNDGTKRVRQKSSIREGAKGKGGQMLVEREDDRQRTSRTHHTPPPISLQPPSSTPTQAVPSTPPRSTRLSRPITPRSSPRDLSALFAAVSPAKSLSGETEEPGSASCRPGGMRRMLTKTQSLGSPSKLSSSTSAGDHPFSSFAEAGPSTPTRGLGRTASLPSTPSKSPGRLATLAAGGVAVAGNASGGRAKRTYGRERSFLAPVAKPDGRGGKEDDKIRESYAELNDRYQVNNAVDDIHGRDVNSDLLLARAPLPVTDMRSKGENRRFMDELVYLADGIADPSATTTSKQSSSLDILRSMQNDGWVSKMEICGQVEKAWVVFYGARSAEDETMDIVCLLFLAVFALSGSAFHVLLQTQIESCLDLVTENLKSKDDVLRGARETNSDRNHIPKPRYGLVFTASQSSPPVLCHTILTSFVKPSTRRLASFILRTMCGRNPSWSTVSVTQREKAVSRVVKSFSIEAKLLGSRFDMFEKGLASLGLIADPHQPDLDHILQCLQIFSALLVDAPEEPSSSLETRDELATDILSVVIGSSALLSETSEFGERHFCPQSRQAEIEEVLAIVTSIESLEILANMSNLSYKWANKIASVDGAITVLGRILLQRERYISSIAQAQTAETKKSGPLTSDGLLCLVLALLTTAILSVKSAAQNVTVTKIDASCLDRPACLRKCRCLTARPLPSHLVDIYVQQLATQDEPDAGIMIGYLALLLSKLLVNSSAASDIILPLLPGTDRNLKLKGLLSSLSELNGLQTLVHRKLRDMVGDDEVDKDESEVDVLERAIEELKGLID
ncbi:hypothetical protein P7C73_g86, partial [Tremellales sp. Uapishka_1]